MGDKSINRRKLGIKIERVIKSVIRRILEDVQKRIRDERMNRRIFVIKKRRKKEENEKNIK